MATPEYDAVMTVDEYNAMYGNTPASEPQYDAVMTADEYNALYGAKDGSFFSMNTAENLPKSLVKGAADLAGMATLADPVNLMKSAYAGASDWYSGKSAGEALQTSLGKAFEGSNQIKDIRQEYVGEPVYDSKGGQYAGKVLEQVPGALLPGSTVGRSLFTALTSGVGGQAALDLGLPEPVGNILGVFGPAGASGVKNIVSRTAQRLGPEAKILAAKQAAKDIVSEVADPDEVIKSLRAAQEVDAAVPWIEKQSENYLPKFARTAEVSQSPGMAGLEETLRRTSPEFKTAATVQDIAREEARQNIFEGLSKGNIDKVGAAGKVRTALTENLSSTKDEVAKLAEKAFTGETDIISAPIKRAVTGNIKQFTKTGARQVSKDFQKLADNFRKLPPRTDLKTLQDFNSAFGEYAKVPAVGATTVDRMTARIANKVRNSIDNTVEKAVQNGEVSKSTANAWYAMREARLAQGNKFERGAVATILRQDPFNAGYKLSGSKVFDKIQTPEDAVQLMEALKGKPGCIAGAREGVLAKIYEKSFNPNTDQFNSATFMKNVRSLNMGGDKILTPSQVKALEKISSDYKSQKNVAALAYRASKGNSITAESLPMVDMIKQSVKTEAISKIKKIPVVGGAIGMVMDVVQNPAQREALINQELVKLASDPKYAEMLLSTDIKKATPLLEGFSKALIQRVTPLSVDISQAITPDRGYHPMDDKAESPTSTPTPKPTPQQVSQLIEQQEPLVRAVISAESSGNHEAVSKTGAKGLMQLMPATAKAWGVEDPFDPAQNIEGGKKNLEAELKRFGDIRLAVAAYNLGGTKLAAIIKRLGTNDYNRISHARCAGCRRSLVSPAVPASLAGCSSDNRASRRLAMCCARV